MRREPPQINAGSMADIAFLLLIFWLVATALQPDRGIADVLKAKDDETKIAVPTKASDLLRVYITEDGEYEVEINGKHIMELDELEQTMLYVKQRAGFRAKLVVSAHYDAPYEAYLLLLQAADELKLKTIENEIKEEKSESGTEH